MTSLTAYFGNVGTGAGTAAIGDTTLFTEVGTARISITPTRVTVTNANDTAQYVFTFTAGTTVTPTNAGYFTLSSAGTLMQKSDFSAIPLLNGDSIQFTFQNKQQ